MIQIKSEYNNGKFDCLNIYSDNNKKIYEPKINYYWDTNENNTIAVAKSRYDNGDYIESDELIDIQ